MKRVRRAEWMDRPDVDPFELDRSLGDLRGVNRWLGGERSARGHVLDLLRRLGTDPVRILDVGTGSGDLPVAIRSAAMREGRSVEIVATDLHAVTVAHARRALAGCPEILVMRADGQNLPFADGAFDLAMCCTTLHHFSEPDAVRILRELGRVARWGVVITDLARSRLAYLGASLLARTVWRGNPVTRHDGPVSVRAAFTPAELAGIARESGYDGAIARRQPIFRLSLVLDRTRSAAVRTEVTH